MPGDGIGIKEGGQASVLVQSREQLHDGINYRVRTQVHKYWGKVSHDEILAGKVQPYAVEESTGNLLVRGGASLLWEYMRGNGSTASTHARKYFNATAAIGVGNSTAAATNIQTALQGGSQLLRVLAAGYPQHTTGSTAATVADTVYRSTYSTTQANFAWQEWGLFNKATTTQRRMFNRRVQSLGTKTSAASWTFTVTLSLS